MGKQFALLVALEGLAPYSHASAIARGQCIQAKQPIRVMFRPSPRTRTRVYSAVQPSSVPSLRAFCAATVHCSTGIGIAYLCLNFYHAFPHRFRANLSSFFSPHPSPFLSRVFVGERSPSVLSSLML